MTSLLLLETLSPLHAGTGQSTGAVDLPIARERATHLPYLPGSSLKGSLRDRAQAAGNGANVTAVFGPDTANASDSAGAVAFGDANLLLLPVRSVAGTFAWVTSALLLERLARDARDAGLKALAAAAAECANLAKPQDNCFVLAGHRLAVQVPQQKGGPVTRVVLEDFDLQIAAEAVSGDGLHTLATELAKYLFPQDSGAQQRFQSRLCVVHDDLLSYLALHGTDVVTRVALDDNSKTVKQGQLWTEENLPVGTILVSVIQPLPNAKSGLKAPELTKQIADLAKLPIQLGGKASVGRGRCQLQLVQGGQR